jgi:hypothetical protein
MIHDFITAARVGLREFCTAWRNERRMREMMREVEGILKATKE